MQAKQNEATHFIPIILQLSFRKMKKNEITYKD